ncbi:DUF5723 family protein [Bacteroidota bacterium]
MQRRLLYKRILAVLLFVSALTLPGSIFSQEMLGIVNSNYAGSAGISINPSNLVNSRLYLDINLVSADIFAENNYLYIKKEDWGLFKVFGPNGIVPKYGENEILFNRRRNDKLKNIFLNFRIQGPSFMISKNDHAIAFHTALRSVSSVRRMPYEVANFGYEGIDYEPQQNIRYNDHNFRITNLDWMEFGLTYSGVIYKYGMNRISGGITIKYLAGFAGGYADVRNLDYMVLNDSTINVNNLDATIGYSLPLNYSDNSSSTDPLFKGRGIGFDLGVTYMKTKKEAQNRYPKRLCEKEYTDYYYRLGLSLLDIGKITFKENARQYTYDNLSTFWEEIDTLNFTNLDQIISMMSEQFYGDPDASLSAEKIGIVLPSAISAQFDYQYLPNFFINATAIVPVRLGKYYVRRASQFAITPRYENRWYELSLPISLYEMRYPRIGLAFRIAFLTIGTEKLGAYFALSDFEGMDFYCSVKINFSKGICLFNKRSKGCYNNEYRYKR